MAQDDSAPAGLFSKMAKFVRRPGTPWSDVDEASSVKDGGLSKQALKEMIERKKRNDFVRRREFDMLRKLRRREATGAESLDASVRPSFFQSSMPSRPDDRARTLKKIDEIEAQMSMQWWKTKHGNGAGSTSAAASSEFSVSEINARSAPSDRAAPAPMDAAAKAYALTTRDNLGETPARGAEVAASDTEAATLPAALVQHNADAAKVVGSFPAQAPQLPELSERYEPTGEAAPVRKNSLEFTADDVGAVRRTIKTQSIAKSNSEAKPSMAQANATTVQANPVVLAGLATSQDGVRNSTSFSVSKMFAIEVDEVQHDPELEEAAIRFANGDDAGAETGLIEAIGAHGSRHQHEETWLTLFDLYRATAQYDRFESLAIDFASYFHRSSPMWFSIPDMVGQLSGAAPVEMPAVRKSDWKCPTQFGIQTLAALNAALAKSPMPWSLDWANLQKIDVDAIVPLTKLWLGWAGQNVQLRFGSASNLEAVLRQSTPSGNRETHQDHWHLLMAYLRMAHRPDEFELAALDFCVTYEVSPPAWESARCEFKLLDAEGNTGLGQTIIGDAVRDSVVSELQSVRGELPTTISAQLASVEMSGEITGEPKPVLDQLEARLVGADLMIISCAKLIRVDFSAAGSLLNWVSARQAEGRVVKFTDVHRLVAAFFHVIGISEHAKVETRVD